MSIRVMCVRLSACHGSCLYMFLLFRMVFIVTFLEIMPSLTSGNNRNINS